MKNLNTIYPVKPNPLMPNKKDYIEFVKAMKIAANEGNLPIRCEHQEPMYITMENIKEFQKVFKEDTGLYIDCQIFTCNNCDKLHFYLNVDYPAEYYIEG